MKGRVRCRPSMAQRGTLRTCAYKLCMSVYGSARARVGMRVRQRRNKTANAASLAHYGAHAAMIARGGPVEALQRTALPGGSGPAACLPVGSAARAGTTLVGRTRARRGHHALRQLIARWCCANVRTNCIERGHALRERSARHDRTWHPPRRFLAAAALAPCARGSFTHPHCRPRPQAR